MKSNAQKLNEFHLAIDGELAHEPTIPSSHIIQLRETLISEEYKEVLEQIELIQSGETADISNLMHELADLLYVTYGTFSAFGVDADAVFAEVHRANMTKLEGPRRADGKLLKPPGWQPANVAGIIAGQGIEIGD